MPHVHMKHMLLKCFFFKPTTEIFEDIVNQTIGVIDFFNCV